MLSGRPEFQALAVEIAGGADLGPWFDAALTTTGDLDYGPALDWFGLRFCDSDDATKKGEGSSSPGSPGGWLGIEAETSGGRLLAAAVQRGGPAHAGGVNAGDEIVAIGGYRIAVDGLRERLKHYRPGTAETLLVARRERLLRLPVVFAAPPRLRFRLEADPGATDEQRRRLAAWLGEAGDTEKASAAPG